MLFSSVDLSSPEDLRTFVLRERELSVSEREWRHRLRGYGYDLRLADDVVVITGLGRSEALCELPTTPAAEAH